MKIVCKELYNNKVHANWEIL